MVVPMGISEHGECLISCCLLSNRDLGEEITHTWGNQGEGIEGEGDRERP